MKTIQVHQSPQNNCGDNREGILYCIILYYIYIHIYIYICINIHKNTPVIASIQF